ncbi:hypothetical protein [Pseudomonas sp. HY7a-MNA-CIBAN-0227]|uniref:hypothetical protein n=1 Tax=Pseudomonas sp. HY7a-MNA-CIBAN-0227 TaxID=3140474 RepID=UPI003327B1D7
MSYDDENDNPFEISDSEILEIYPDQTIEQIFEEQILLGLDSEEQVAELINNLKSYNKLYAIFNRRTALIKREIELKAELKSIEKEKIELDVEYLSYSNQKDL